MLAPAIALLVALGGLLLAVAGIPLAILLAILEWSFDERESRPRGERRTRDSPDPVPLSDAQLEMILDRVLRR